MVAYTLMFHHVSIPYIFGTFGSQLPIYQVTIDPLFQVYRIHAWYTIYLHESLIFMGFHVGKYTNNTRLKNNIHQQHFPAKKTVPFFEANMSQASPQVWSDDATRTHPTLGEHSSSPTQWIPSEGPTRDAAPADVEGKSCQGPWQ